MKSLIPIWYFMKSKKALSEPNDGDALYVIGMFVILAIVFVALFFWFPGEA